MKILRIFCIACVVALLLVPAAVAGGGSANKGYGGSAGNVQNGVGPANGAFGQAKAVSGGLPLTGLDLGLLVAGAAVLVVVGAGLRRAAAKRTP